MKHLLPSALLFAACLALPSKAQTEKPAASKAVVSGQKPLDPNLYKTRRAAFKTKLIKRGPSPQEGENDPLPAKVTKINYPSEGRNLGAWLYRPDPDVKKLRPALVYLHGGNAFGASDLTDCQPFIDAGYIVLCPSFRGENGNPGNYEMFMGEVDDAAASVRWLAQQAGVDTQRIFVFGHSSGGIMSAMLSLFDDIPAKHTGSSGGLYGEDLFDYTDGVPFDINDREERKMRVLPGHIAWMKRPHHAFVGAADRLMQVQAVEAEVKATQAPLTVVKHPGNHFTSLPIAMRSYLKLCQQ